MCPVNIPKFSSSSCGAMDQSLSPLLGTIKVYWIRKRGKGLFYSRAKGWVQGCKAELQMCAGEHESGLSSTLPREEKGKKSIVATSQFEGSLLCVHGAASKILTPGLLQYLETVGIAMRLPGVSGACYLPHVTMCPSLGTCVNQETFGSGTQGSDSHRSFAWDFVWFLHELSKWSFSCKTHGLPGQKSVVSWTWCSLSQYLCYSYQTRGWQGTEEGSGE